MPRSSNPLNYSEVYWKLAEACLAGVKELRLEMPAKRAFYQRYQIYSFIRALERTAPKLKKEGNIRGAQEYITAANALRGYILQIFVNGELVTTKINTQQPAELVLTNRDLCDEAQDMLAAIAAQFAPEDAPRFAPEDEHLEMPSPIGNLFNKPLETYENEHSEDSGEDSRSDSPEEEQHGNGFSHLPEQATGDSDTSEPSTSKIGTRDRQPKGDGTSEIPQGDKQ